MRPYRRILLSLALLAVLPVLAGSPKYKLVWKDNFRGKSFNEKFWSKSG